MYMDIAHITITHERRRRFIEKTRMMIMWWRNKNWIGVLLENSYNTLYVCVPRCLNVWSGTGNGGEIILCSFHFITIPVKQIVSFAILMTIIFIQKILLFSFASTTQPTSPVAIIVIFLSPSFFVGGSIEENKKFSHFAHFE